MTLQGQLDIVQAEYNHLLAATKVYESILIDVQEALGDMEFSTYTQEMLANYTGDCPHHAVPDLRYCKLCKGVGVGVIETLNDLNTVQL